MSVIRYTDEKARLGQAVSRLQRAADTRVPCTPVRDLIDRNDVAAAYHVQQRLVQARLASGDRVVGHKIGLTSTAVQNQLGVDRPDFGVLMRSMQVGDGSSVSASDFLQPRVEAEVAFILSVDLIEGPLDHDQIRSAIGSVHPALEICDSRIENWDISFADTVADNASAGGFVLGPARSLADVEPREVDMSMSIDGEIVSRGTGRDCLGDPLTAVVWLARQTRDLGDPLRAGSIVLSGALGPMRPVSSGSRVHVRISGLGEVGVDFGADAEKRKVS